MIEVHDLTKRYGSHLAVDTISFEAHPGEVVGLLGPNGAGKTTTMRILTGFMPPTGGTARIAGYDVMADSLEVRRRVGYLPERVPVYPDMTVSGYITFWAKLRGVTRPRAQVDAVLERVNLTDRRNTLIRNLSKGLRQRLGLAQALVHNPEVVILDEPTIGIDPQQVIEVRESVRELGKNHTVLFSTHILSEAEQVCDSVVIIHRGTIVAQGSPSELRSTLERGGRVFVRTNAPAETALPRLQQLAQVAQVEAGLDGIIITPADPNADPRPAIARAVLENGWDLIELRPLAVNLEEIFLELTRAPEAAAEAEPTPESEVVA